MSRDDGFRVADTDVGLLGNTKVLALARRLRDPVRTAAAVTLYDAVRLLSWEEGERVTLAESVPAWWLEGWEDLAAELVAVGLLDTEQRVPLRAWEGWYGPAFTRRLNAKRRNIFAALRSHGWQPDEANDEADRRIVEMWEQSGLSLAYRPSLKAMPKTRASYRSDRSVRSDKERIREEQDDHQQQRTSAQSPGGLCAACLRRTDGPMQLIGKQYVCGSCAERLAPSREGAA